MFSSLSIRWAGTALIGSQCQSRTVSPVKCRQAQSINKVHLVKTASSIGLAYRKSNPLVSKYVVGE